MNILRAATLVAIFIKCVSASSDKMPSFLEAVDREDMSKALWLYWSISDHVDEALSYVINTKKDDFISDFARQAEIGKGTLFLALHRNKKSPKMIEEIIKVVKIYQADLIRAASEPTSMCSPNDLFILLGRLENQKYQE